MREPLITAAQKLTGKILSGNPYMPNGSKQLMNKFNDMMYRR